MSNLFNERTLLEDKINYSAVMPLEMSLSFRMILVVIDLRMIAGQKNQANTVEETDWPHQLHTLATSESTKKKDRKMQMCREA